MLNTCLILITITSRDNPAAVVGFNEKMYTINIGDWNCTRDGSAAHASLSAGVPNQQ